jgi:hypothetical protein
MSAAPMGFRVLGLDVWAALTPVGGDGVFGGLGCRGFYFEKQLGVPFTVILVPSTAVQL